MSGGAEGGQGGGAPVGPGVRGGLRDWRVRPCDADHWLVDCSCLSGGGWSLWYGLGDPQADLCDQMKKKLTSVTR